MTDSATPTSPSPVTGGDLVTLLLEVLPPIVRMLQQAASAPGDEPLTLSQFRLLKAISADCRRTADLATRFDLAPATVSASIEALVRRGLVQRSGYSAERPADRRVIPLMLTEAGARALGAARRRQRAALEALLQSLSPEERDALTASFSSLERHLSAVRRSDVL